MKPIIYEIVTYLLHYIKCSGSNLTHGMLSLTEKPLIGAQVTSYTSFLISPNLPGILDMGSFASLALETVDELFLWGVHLFRACDALVAIPLPQNIRMGTLMFPFTSQKI